MRHCYVITAALCWVSVTAKAQSTDAKFTLPVEVGQGFNHSGGLDLYLATLQLAPQWALTPNLRAGFILGVYYPGNQIGGLIGGRLAYKIKEGPTIAGARTFQLYLLGEYLPVVWDKFDSRQQWVGAGLQLETSNLLGIAFKLHRDFQRPATYGQLALSYNLRRKSILHPEP